MSDVTQILLQLEAGDPAAANQLLPLVYEELRRLAASRMAREKPNHTLQATALVHEAYLRLVHSRAQQNWDSRAHFFAAAAEAMRRILIEQARRKRSAKRGGAFQQVAFDDELCAVPSPGINLNIDLLALDDALKELEVVEPKKAALVKLRCFAGLSLAESAVMLDISEATAKRYWVYARSWLYGRIHQQ